MSGKLLMFEKLVLKNFTYDLVEPFCFPVETVKEIFKK